MQQKNGSNWKYDKALDCMLFFAQRVDELLFHHTTDTYRFPALSLSGIADEFCTVYEDAKRGIIHKKNCSHIIEEFNDRLKKDSLAKSILSAEYVERFEKNHENWDIKQQYENITYIYRKLGNYAYYNAIKKRLKELIKENKEKKEIDSLATRWVREVIDCGYTENYVYRALHQVFYHDKVDSIDSLDRFFNMFNFKKRKYDVYIGFSEDLTPIKSLFEKMILYDAKIVLLTPSEAPKGIKTKNQRTIIKFESIRELDIFSAYEKAFDISTRIVDSYAFFRHDGSSIKIYGQVVDEDKSIVHIIQKQLLKDRVSPLSRLDSKKNADELLTALFSNRRNLNDLQKIVKIHNSALKSENINDSLLSLWSLIESLFISDNNEESKEENDNSQYKSGTVIELLIPFLKSTYVSKLVQTFIADVKHWDQNFFDDFIVANGFGENELEHAFAFLTFESTQTARDELYSRTSQYPLLKNRVCILYEQLHDIKSIKATLAAHKKRLTWQIQRIYRARNYIIHDGRSNDRLNHDLLINLHSYVDTLISKIVELINKSPYNDTVLDIITEHKLEVSIFDEMLEKQKNENINETNAKKLLYYRFSE